MLALHKNPLIYRHSRMATRPGKVFASFMVVLALMALGYLYIFMEERFSAHQIDYAKVLRVFCMYILVIQLLMAFYGCLAVTLESVVTEKVGNTYEFFVTLPITAVDKVIGLCAGKTLMLVIAVLILVPLGLFSALFGGLSMSKLAWLYVLTFAGCLAFSLLGVAVSSSIGKNRGVWVLMVLLFFFLGSGLSGLGDDNDFTAVPFMTLSPFAFFRATVEPAWNMAAIFRSGGYHFYGLEVPWQVCPLVLYAFFACVSFVVAARKLSRPEPRPLQKWAVILAFVVFQFLLTGFLADSLQASRWDPIDVTKAYFIAFFVVTLGWGVFSCPEYAGLMEWVEKKHRWPVRLLTESFTDIRTPSFIPATVLWLVTAATVICIDRLYWQRLGVLPVLVIALVELVFIWAYQSLFLAGCLSVRRYGRAVGAVFVVAAILIPSVFSSIEGMGWLSNATPLGVMDVEGRFLWGYLVDGSSVPSAVYESLALAAGQLVVFGLLAALLFNRIHAISPRGRQQLIQRASTG